MHIAATTPRAERAMHSLATTPALAMLTERGWLEHDHVGYTITADLHARLSTGEQSLLAIMDLLSTLALEIAPLDTFSRADVADAFAALFAKEVAPTPVTDDVVLVPLLSNEGLVERGFGA